MPEAVRTLGRVRILFIVAAVVVCADRWSKIAACAFLTHGEPVTLIGAWVQLTLVFNAGGAFGIMKGAHLFFIATSSIISSLIILSVIKYKVTRPRTLITLGLILGGALGNLIDRIAFGYVIDFIDLGVWPVFNVADSCVTIGTIVVGVSLCIPYFSRSAR